MLSGWKARLDTLPVWPLSTSAGAAPSTDSAEVPNADRQVAPAASILPFGLNWKRVIDSAFRRMSVSLPVAESYKFKIPGPRSPQTPSRVPSGLRT